MFRIGTGLKKLPGGAAVGEMVEHVPGIESIMDGFFGRDLSMKMEAEGSHSIDSP